MKMINKCTIEEGGTIRQALEALNASGEGIALVVNPAGKLLGVLTDGNLRRAFLQGAGLSDSVAAYMTTNFLSVTPQQDRASVLDLMQARLLRHIPIVDAQERLVGLHLLREIVGHNEKPNWAIIMAGGKGTRLYPLTKNIPKPMIKVAGRPILERIVLHLVTHGIRRIFISVNYLGHIIRDYFGDGHAYGCRIEYLEEAEPLGTGGSLALLPKTEHPVVVMNADLIVQVNIDDLLCFHARGGYYATMGVRPYIHEIAYGCVTLDGSQICQLREKPVMTEIINAGVYVISPEALATVPREFYPITRLFEDGLARHQALGAYMIDDEWIDVGQHAQLKRACQGE